MIKPGTPNERVCGCRTSYRVIFLDQASLLPNGDHEHRCGKHLNITDGARQFRFVTKYPIGNPDQGESLCHLTRGIFPHQYPELLEFIRANPNNSFRHGTHDWDRMILTARQTVLDRGLHLAPHLRIGAAAAGPAAAPAAAPAARPPAAPAAARPAAAPARPAAAPAAAPVNRVLFGVPMVPNPVPPIRNDTALMTKRAKSVKVRAPPPPPPPVYEPPPAEVVYMHDPAVPMLAGETRDCSICLSDVGTVICSERKHTMCAECFEEHAVMESSDPSFDGNLRCCASKGFGCKAEPFSTFLIIRQLTSEKAQQFFDGFKRSHERVVVDEFKRLELKRVAEEGLKSDLEKAKDHIFENILTLRCPKEGCGMAFIDFTGCLALTCPRCKSGICAKCFKQFGSNAHSHIQRGECEMDNCRDLFASQTYITQVQKLYKTQKLDAYVKTLAPSVATTILTNYKKEIKEAGVNI